MDRRGFLKLVGCGLAAAFLPVQGVYPSERDVIHADLTEATRELFREAVLDAHLYGAGFYKVSGNGVEFINVRDVFRD